MPHEHDPSSPDASFAPAPRLDLAAVRAQRETFLADPLALAVLEAMPVPAVVLNAQRQIVLGNRAFLDLFERAEIAAALALRPGEAMGCVHAGSRAGGCGTTESCSACGAAGAILAGLSGGEPAVRECSVRTLSGGGGALDLRVQATPLTVGGADFVLLAFQDISSEKRRRVLERVFFHDVLNACGGVRGLAEVLLEDALDAEAERRLKRDIHTLSGIVIDEISAHRQMLEAERGELLVRPVEVAVRDVLDEVVALYRHHLVAEGRAVRIGACPDASLRTDVALLRRVLGNLVKNALEATLPGETVTVSAEVTGGDVRFAVHNPGAIPPRVRLQVFQRSFSTKGGDGRGIGTYSVKLFGEGFLGGRVAFTSDEFEGTVFSVTLPVIGPPPAEAAAA